MCYNDIAHSVLDGGVTLPNEKEQLISDEMSEKILEAAENIVMTCGAGTLTVRKILTTLNITNRVFYNRFHNIDEVLAIVYENTTLKIRESILSGLDEKKDFFENAMDLAVKTLAISYETKMQFNQYVFENDSLTENNYEWWKEEIKKLIEYAKANQYIKDVDSEKLSYSLWCFCRGFNADAVARNLPRDEAEKTFRYGFGFLLDGLKRTC